MASPTLLNTEQKMAFKMAIEGHNFVILGSAGTGKSTVVSAIVEQLISGWKKVALKCSTGIACRVYDQIFKATTIYRFTGIAVGRHGPKEIGPWILSSPSQSEVLQRIRETDVVILDECSMISARTLESICEVLSLKDTSILFGGIQVIVCGDFRQLPAVKDNYYGDDGSNCFEADFFPSVFPHRVVLTEVVRQTDKVLINSILEVSKGTVLEETIRFVKYFERKLQDTSPGDIHLFARNDIVDDYNRKQILDCPVQLYEYTAIDEVGNKSKLIN